MSSRCWSTLTAGFVAALLALGMLYRSSDAEPAAGVGARSGMMVDIDPETGEFTVPPADVATGLDAHAAQAPSRLVERPSPTPGGGVLLTGAPLASMAATVDANGHVSARCGE
jgi:hypothetical protein